MADVKPTGPSATAIIVIAVVATPLVLLVIFWLVGSGPAEATTKLPDLRGKGLRWANAEADSSGFGSVDTHDALGRDRSWRDNRDWKVCFQVPGAGGHPKGTVVELGVVKIDERCPSSDQGRYDRSVKTMPNLTNRTAFMTTKILGADASIRFLDRKDGDEVTGGLGNWRVCGQTPKVGERFDGLPVTTIVVPYETRC